MWGVFHFAYRTKGGEWQRWNQASVYSTNDRTKAVEYQQIAEYVVGNACAVVRL